MTKFAIRVLDQEYELRLNINKLCDIEAQLGTGIAETYLGGGAPSITALREAVYVGLGGKKRKAFTRDEAGKVFMRDRERMTENTREILKAIAYAQGADDASLTAYDKLFTDDDDDDDDGEKVDDNNKPLGKLEDGNPLGGAGCEASPQTVNTTATA